MRDKPRAFISFTHQDSEVADRIAFQLNQANISIFQDKISLPAGSSISTTIRSELSASDYLILLLSPEALKSNWFIQELEYAIEKDWRERAITVIPIKIKPCKIPTYISSWMLIDATRNLDNAIKKLIELLRAAPEVNFDKFSPIEFEELIYDFLKEYKFKNIQQASGFKDYGYDFIASHENKDPFGRNEISEWIVEVNAYKRRTDLSSLHAFAGSLSLRKESIRGLFITTSQLTSSAREWLEHTHKRGGPKISVLEGTELKRLILTKKRLINKYFSESMEI